MPEYEINVSDNGLIHSANSISEAKKLAKTLVDLEISREFPGRKMTTKWIKRSRYSTFQDMLLVEDKDGVEADGVFAAIEEWD